MADKDILGRAGEDRAAQYFVQQGYQVLDRNWRCSSGELDLIVRRGDEVVFVEVKTRTSEGFGHPFEALDVRKRARLWRVSMAWIAAHRDAVQGCRTRVDAIGLVGADPSTAVVEHLVDVDAR
ncbi:YraN family protein [Microbacterium sp. C7(2022)]|uniref:YraN family protein n=1 Tax=Microbacterium sp. C7(2022) TaxID=2992759 RepID=UPI00237B1F58|nr:YraN family protein [Microbacterium sp. C7(2022)]MDE0546909.1 YraN family protein [Microbacterium sp. C7(2022)]